MLVRLFVFFGGLFVLALTAALIAPYFIDWSGYRADFEREASAILGRQVTVEGDATARLLPFPSVTFADVSVGGGPDGQPAMTVETFSMDAELAPFLSGQVLIFDMRLVRPRATIDISDGGAVDWAIRPSAPYDAGHISIEKLTVTEGQLTVRHAASGRTHLVSEINTELSAKMLSGPWRITGSARVDGRKADLSITTGSVDADGAMRLRVRAGPEAYATEIESDGNIRFDGPGMAVVYSGTFKMGPRADSAPDKGARKLAPVYRVGGKFTLDHKRLSVEEFHYETGPLDDPYSADGSAYVDFGDTPSFSLVADGAQVRFDEAIGAETKGGGLTFSERIAALHDVLLDLPRPTIPGTVEVNLPAIVAGDTTIRDVRLSAEPAADGWTIKSAAAALPGRTTLEADGKLVTSGNLGFTGSLLVAVGQPSGFAAWLSKDVDDAIRRLPGAGFKANVDLTERKQRFSDLELVLGGATFHGDAENLQPEDALPSATIKLSGGALDVDGLAAFASLFVSDQLSSRFAGGDLDLDLKAGPVSVAGLTAGTVDAGFRLRGGTLEIDRLSIGSLAGVTISAAGTLRDFPQDPSGKVDASILAEDPTPLLAALADRFGSNVLVAGLNRRAAAYPGLFDDARIDVVATRERASGLIAEADGVAGGTSFKAQMRASGTIGGLADDDLTLTVDASNSDATSLLALYGLPVLPLGLPGEGSTHISAQGKLPDGLQTSLSLTGNDFSAGFTGTVGADDEAALAIKGSVALKAADLEPWLMTAGLQGPQMGFGLPVDLEANADYSNGLLVLAGLHGIVDENSIDGDINGEIKAGRPHLTGQLTVDELDLDTLVTAVLGQDALASVSGEWSEVPFPPKMIIPVTAELGIDTASLSAGPFADAYDAGMTVRLDDEGLRVSDLQATLFDGKLGGLFELKNNGGTALLSGQLKLEGADIERGLGETGLTGKGDFSVALTASGKSVGGLIASLTGSGTAGLSELAVAGVNPDALKAFIAKADAAGRDIDQAATAGFAPAIASDGVFAAAPVSVAFTVAGGVLRAPPVTLDNPAATIETDLQADARSGVISATGTISYRAGDDALVGSDPALRFTLEGPPGATVRTFDSAPLAQFLTQRALEIEQARVEAMQAALLERQRLRREVRYYAALQAEADRAAEEARRRREEQTRADAAEKAAAAERATEEKRQRAEDLRLADEEAAAASPPDNAKPLQMDGFMQMLQGVQ